MANTISQIIDDLYAELASQEKTASPQEPAVDTDLGKSLVKLASTLRAARTNTTVTHADVEKEFSKWAR